MPECRGWMIADFCFGKDFSRMAETETSMSVFSYARLRALSKKTVCFYKTVKLKTACKNTED